MAKLCRTDRMWKENKDYTDHVASCDSFVFLCTGRYRPQEAFQLIKFPYKSWVPTCPRPKNPEKSSSRSDHHDIMPHHVGPKLVNVTRGSSKITIFLGGFEVSSIQGDQATVREAPLPRYKPTGRSASAAFLRGDCDAPVEYQVCIRFNHHHPKVVIYG